MEVTIIRAFEPDDAIGHDVIAVCAFTSRATAHELREACDEHDVKWEIETVRVDNEEDKASFLGEVEQ